MNEWWETLSSFEKVMWGLAIPSSLIFIVQSIMTFLGMDADADLDVDFDGDMGGEQDSSPFQLFTFRNMVNFFLGFSWTGISLYNDISNKLVLGLISFA